MRILLLIILSSFSFAVIGQSVNANPYFYDLGLDYEFESNTVYDIFEDQKSNIWLATNEGLYRWDGLQFKNFKNTNFASAYSNIQENEDGIIWCQNFTGQLFVLFQDSMYLYDDLNQLVNSRFDYRIDYFPEIYYFTDFGLFKSSFLKKELTHFSMQGQNSFQSFDNRNKLLKKEILLSPTPSSDGFNFSYSAEPYLFNVNSMKANRLMNGRENWNDNKIIQFNFQSPVIFGFSNEEHHSIYFNQTKHNSWEQIEFGTLLKVNASAFYLNSDQNFALVGDTKGLGKIDFNSKKYTRLIDGYNVSKILKDREGNYWISSLNKGVIIIPELELFEFKKPNNRSIFIQARGQLYIISQEGVIYQYYNRTLHEKAQLDLTNGLGNYHYNRNKNLLFFESESFVFNLNTLKPLALIDKKEFKSLFKLNDKLELVSSSFFLAFETNDSTSFKDYRYYIPKEKYIIRPARANKFRITLRDKRCHSSCYVKKEKKIYGAFNDGLYAFYDNKIQEIKFENKSVLSNELKTFENETWLNDIENRIFCLKDGHLQLMFKGASRITDFWVDKNVIYVATLNGVIRYNTRTRDNFDLKQEDGLNSNATHSLTLYRDTLFISTVSGISVVHKDFNFQNQTVPIVDLIDVSVNEKKYYSSDLNRLNHDENNLTFTFKSMNLRARGNYSFYYKIEGIDSVWQVQKSQTNFCRYPSLPPGEYTFKLKAINEDKLASKVVTIPIKIDYPFYQKWWFYFSIITGLFLLAFAIFYIRIRIIKSRNALLSDKQTVEKELSKSQLTALKSQMNPHFVFNALNSIQDYIITNAKEEASDYLGLFADLMRKYLNQSQYDFISLDEEIETLRMYLTLEKVRFEESLNYLIKYDNDVDLSNYFIPSMLIQPFVENSIKHGLLHKEGEKKLSVEITITQENEFKIIVSDNGIGRLQSDELKKTKPTSHKPFASSALERRISLLNLNSDYHISIHYTDLLNPTGTIVEIFITDKRSIS